MSTETLQSLVADRRGSPSLISTRRVLRNAYGLLSLTLLWTAGTAAASAASALPHPGLLALFGFGSSGD